MLIALDATYSVGEELSGVGVYSNEILFGIADAHPEASFRFCYRPHRFLRSMRAHLPRNCRRALLHDRWRGFGSADLFHGLNQRMPATGSTRRVCTFHDLFVLTGDYSTHEFRARFAQQAREAAERSDLIIAVSQFTADQVHNLLNVPKEKLRIVHHGVRAVPDDVVEKREKLVLTVGAVQRRKNFIRLVQAFNHASPEWRLAIAGSAGYGADAVLSEIAQSPARDRISVLGYVSDNELERLYARAGIFAFPSLDEGFGMPVLDAMARGVPVITSNRSAMPEVSGDAALLVDPENTEQLRGELLRLMEDDSLRADLSRRGIQRAGQFNWETAVQKTWQIYEELLEG